MSTPDRQQLLRDAVEEILDPLAALCVSQGLPFAQAEELFKRAYVRAARQARRDAGAGAARDISQVSTATGISRREVTRISAQLQPRAALRPAPATELFLRWLADRRLRDRQGRPRPLPRTGRAPSFESLAMSITRHVHPRSLLDELLRRGLVALSDDGQTVQLSADRFVPQEDDRRLFALLAANVGDHLSAATANVIHRDRRHFEQAVFTDELSDTAARQVRALAQAQWATLLAALVPALQQLIDDDKAQGRPPTQRARIGMFSFHEPMTEMTDETQPDPMRSA